MSTAIGTFVPAATALDDPQARAPEREHKRLMAWMLLVFTCAGVVLALYGADYYRLSQTARAFSPKHHLLKPGGVVGINLGLLGVLMLCGIFLYPLRKRWRWLQRQGNSKRWLDHHIVLGVAAPVCIAFHSSFKFRGLAGLAFWLMVAVSLSGLIGRYLYAQVLQEVAEAESSLLEFKAMLEQQRTLTQADLMRLLPTLPDPSRISRWSALTAVIYMLASDLVRPFRVTALRMKVMGKRAVVPSMLGIGASRNAALDGVIRLARKHALLSRRILLLSHAKRIFQLWHVVHKPFSYAFAVLALLHIGVAMIMGFL